MKSEGGSFVLSFFIYPLIEKHISFLFYNFLLWNFIGHAVVTDKPLKHTQISLKQKNKPTNKNFNLWISAHICIIVTKILSAWMYYHCYQIIASWTTIMTSYIPLRPFNNKPKVYQFEYKKLLAYYFWRDRLSRGNSTNSKSLRIIAYDLNLLICIVRILGVFEM